MRATVVFITDFGISGCGAMAGVVKSVSSDLDVYDFTHEIEPYNIRQAAYELSTVTPFWPAGTVFVSVVDPGVGSSRRSCVARLTSGCYVVTPDNGTLTMVRDDIEAVWQIDERTQRLPGSEDVHIFAGRDVFAYVAARIAAGLIRPDEVGPSYPVSEVVWHPLTNVVPRMGDGWSEGGVYDIDAPFGSMRINVRNRDFQRIGGFTYGDPIAVWVGCGDRVVYEGTGRYVRTFADAEGVEVFLCGDIEHGEHQHLRLNTRGGLVQTYAPELLSNLGAAADYVVRFKRLG